MHVPCAWHIPPGLQQTTKTSDQRPASCEQNISECVARRHMHALTAAGLVSREHAASMCLMPAYSSSHTHLLLRTGCNSWPTRSLTAYAQRSPCGLSRSQSPNTREKSKHPGAGAPCRCLPTQGSADPIGEASPALFCQCACKSRTAYEQPTSSTAMLPTVSISPLHTAPRVEYGTSITSACRHPIIWGSFSPTRPRR